MTYAKSKLIKGFFNSYFIMKLLGPSLVKKISTL